MQVKHNFKLLAYITELRCCVAILVLLNENSSYRTYRLRFSLVDRFADSSLQFRMIFVGQTCSDVYILMISARGFAIS